MRGFSFLEPKRHIPDTTALNGEEARTFGEVIGSVTSALKEPPPGAHTGGDSLNDSMIRGEFTEEPLPSGAVAIVSRDFPSVPEEELRATAGAIRDQLAAG